MHPPGIGLTTHPITLTDGTIHGIGVGAADGIAHTGAGVRAGLGDRAGHGAGTTHGTGVGVQAGVGVRAGDGIIPAADGILPARFTATIVLTADIRITPVGIGHPTHVPVEIYLPEVDTRTVRTHLPMEITISMEVAPRTITARMEAPQLPAIRLE